MRADEGMPLRVDPGMHGAKCWRFDSYVGGGRIVEIRAEGERRRHEHRQAGAAAVLRMRARGETLAAIAELADVKVGDVRTVLQSAEAQTVAPPDALGAPSGATESAVAAPQRNVAGAAATAHALGVGGGP